MEVWMLILRRDFANRGIELRPEDGDTARPDDNEDVTADLRIGSRYNNPGDPTTYDFRGPFVLKSGRCIVVHTKEILSVPDGVFGFIYSRGSLTARGLLVANTKIDPLFHGHLAIALYNAGRRTVVLKPGDSFCSVSFETTEKLTFGRARSAPVVTADPHWRIWYWWAGRPPMAWTILVAIVSSGIGAAVGAVIANLIKK
jgi:deoxycytidine triphosphate deaminase